MMKFIPLHLLALQCSKTLKGWIQSWLGNQANLLEPDDWSKRGHETQNSNWNPTTSRYWCCSKTILESQSQMTGFASQRSHPPLGQAQMVQAALQDSWSRVHYSPTSVDCWPTIMYEPIVIGISPPHSSKIAHGIKTKCNPQCSFWVFRMWFWGHLLIRNLNFCWSSIHNTYSS
jgi:hypothetical protein